MLQISKIILFYLEKLTLLNRDYYLINYYIITEYYEDGTLNDELAQIKAKDEKLEDHDLIAWVMQLVSAIKSLHKSNIIHRDIKPANIFLSRRRLILGDLGLAKNVNSTMTTKSKNSNFKMFGTIPYIAPELMNPLNSYDENIDIWSLGCVLYEMVTLEKLFPRGINENLLESLNIDKIVSEITTSNELIKLMIRGCLSVDPKSRPTANELYSSIKSGKSKKLKKKFGHQISTSLETKSNTVTLETDVPNLSIFVSYCWYDKELSQTFANELSTKKLKVFFDQDKLSFSIYNTSILEKCDLAVICFSKQYFKCFNCQREAHYLFESKIPIFVISLSSDFKPDKWVAKIIAGNSYKKLTKRLGQSEYPKLKDKIFEQILKLNSQKVAELNKIYSSNQNIVLSEQELKTRRLEYDRKYQEQCELERQNVDKERQMLSKVFNSENLLKELDSEVPWIYRWYMNYPSVTLKNYPPFSPNGDINRAVFSLPKDVLDNYQKKMPKVSNFTINSTQTFSISTRRAFNMCVISTEIDKPKESDKNPDTSIQNFMKSIERQSRFYTNFTNIFTRIDRDFYKSLATKREKEIELRNLLDTNINLMKNKRIKLSRKITESFDNNPKDDVLCKFAERMLSNRIEFEKLCGNI